MLSPGAGAFIISLLFTGAHLAAGGVAFLSENYTLSASYGEFCDSEVGPHCDDKASQICVEKRCQCSKPEDMIFDKITGICYVLYGKPCRGAGLRCIKEEYATCHSDGHCTCLDTGFYHTEDGHCLQKQKVRGNCTSQRECMDDEYLICDKETSTCVCDETQSKFFDSEFEISKFGVAIAPRRCAGLVGARCSYPKASYDYIDKDFLARKEKFLSSVSFDGDPCIGGASCKKGKCVCPDDTHFVKNRNCFPRRYFQENCGEVGECGNGLMCRRKEGSAEEEKVCSCPFPEIEEFIGAEKGCVCKKGFQNSEDNGNNETCVKRSTSGSAVARITWSPQFTLGVFMTIICFWKKMLT